MLRLPAMQVPHVLCGLSATALLASCATDSGHAGTTSTAVPPTTAAVTATVTPRPATPGSQTQKWIDLQVGQCVADLPPADLSRITVTLTDCGTPHLAEVYLRAPVAVDSAIATVANRACASGFAPYTGQAPNGSPYSITWLIDSHQDRTGADPTPSTVICLLQAANGLLLTGSARR
uniref:Lipoprotein LppN n=2 Tax=Mycobacterium riyadhense TaxID=486698 RepID=A0A653ELH7_9MYCO|nr:hypothetical protein BIN_B_02157 [Mycobacterium riyadhense]